MSAVEGRAAFGVDAGFTMIPKEDAKHDVVLWAAILYTLLLVQAPSRRPRGVVLPWQPVVGRFWDPVSP